MHSQVFIPEYSILEDGWIGPNVVLTNARYPNEVDSKNTLKGPIIKNKARIGANATILPGVQIGRNSLIGAGCVVTKDVEPNSVVVGNPGKVVRELD